MEDLTFAVVLTAAGATASAALITGLIAIAKQLVFVGPWINADREPTVAFVLSALLVTVAVLSVGVFTPPALFGAFLAWFGIAQIAMGVHDTVKSATTRGNAWSAPATTGTRPPASCLARRAASAGAGAPAARRAATTLHTRQRAGRCSPRCQPSAHTGAAGPCAPKTRWWRRIESMAMQQRDGSRRAGRATSERSVGGGEACRRARLAR